MFRSFNFQAITQQYIYFTEFVCDFQDELIIPLEDDEAIGEDEPPNIERELDRFRQQWHAELQDRSTPPICEEGQLQPSQCYQGQLECTIEDQV